MLTLVVEEHEFYNEETGEFESLEVLVLELEHSLVSLSKWESKYNKPFLTQEVKTPEEITSYIECMIISPVYPPNVVSKLSSSNLAIINEYIESTQTATTFGKMPERKGRGETITSELIYYWMVAFTIPFECERWHLNRLFALIRICNIKNSPQKKLSRSEIARRNRDLNEERKSKLGTSG